MHCNTHLITFNQPTLTLVAPLKNLNKRRMARNQSNLLQSLPQTHRPYIILCLLILVATLHLFVPNYFVQCHAQQDQQTMPALTMTTMPLQLLQARSQVAPTPNLNLQQPIFVRSMDSLNVRENTPIDELVYTLEAQTDQQFQNVRLAYDIEGTQLFSVDRTSGQVRVAQAIDREQTGDSLSFQVIATPYLLNRPGTPTKMTITIYILDENDNAPKIERVKVGRQEFDASALARLAVSSSSGGGQHQTLRAAPIIRLNVSEDAPAESVLVDLIEAIDVDKASSSPLGAICLTCEPEFKLVPQTAKLLNDRLEWSVVLAKQLVHVPRNNLRLLHVLVSDGKFNSSLQFEINIDDVQNKPPHFVGSTTCTVHENTPIDRTIMTLQAIDGDAIALDDGLMQASAQGTKYRGRQIVYDFVDSISGQASSHQEDFKLHPLTGQLQVANRLDREAYLHLNGVLSLQVRARELTVDAETVLGGDDLYETILSKLTNFIDPSELAVTVSDVTIILIDVNDNAPRWLNASEILAMNKAPIWYKSLPMDRDIGRNYQLKVRENCPPGSPITTRNEMFVYDLDAGENAEFNISLEDPFNLFDVEPKRVSGLSSVTLKLASVQANRKWPRLLDYENINERSYIIQLHAIETKTQEQFRSKAQIQVTVLDVNDNAPEFKEAAYVANIREDAPAGKMVKLIQATDRDEVSANKLVYSLHGQTAPLFHINPSSGLVTVAKCSHLETSTSSNQMMRSTRVNVQASNGQQRASVASSSCIDYETQRQHHLMVEVSDGELSSKAPLTIWIEDASDNAPVFTLPIVDVVIEEGAERLDPPIKIEAIDVDQTSTLSYSIIEGNFEGLFAINNATGELQLTRPIRIAHDDELALASGLNYYQAAGSIDRLDMKHHQQPFQQLNKMTLIVQASDGEHTTNGTIRIDILDANDNAPKFSRQVYEKELSELATPGQSVLIVKAFDMDRGNNARVSYRIERGSHNQFEISETTGEISVANQAKSFDVSVRENYTLEVVAYDHGLISKSSSVTVLIKLLAASNKRSPEFAPQIQRVTINENTLNNTIIHRMSISEPQPQQQQQGGHPLLINQPLAIMFEPGRIEGLDKYGQPVIEIERLESMFSVSANTGDVVVNSGLNHDFAAYVNLTLFVSYRPVQGSANIYTQLDPGGANNSQLAEETVATLLPKSVGYFIISVVDDNDNAPIFAAPWTPSQPELAYQMLEELPVGSILAQLVANDADSKISHYEIDPPNEYFELTSPQSGVIVNKKLIDYDTLMRQTFLSPGTYKQQQQQVLTAASSSSSSVGAFMQSTNNNIIQFNVIVYDSGLRQLSAKAIVSVEILPINDNDCKFEQLLYEARVRENALPDTVVSQVRATDLDFGEQHNSVSYQLIGDQRDYFNLDSRTGVLTISARGSLGLDREQLLQPFILLTIVGRDSDFSSGTTSDSFISQQQQQRGAQAKRLAASVSGRSCSTTVKIYVDDVNDNPPLFAQKLYEVSAYDTDTIDVPLIKLLVHDEDSSKHNTTGAKQQANSFRILAGNINDSFNISQTGMIYVTKALNESANAAGLLATDKNGQPIIELRVQVRQQVLPPAPTTSNGGGGGAQSVPSLFTDECLVRVHLMKINRYAPEWRLETLKKVTIGENQRPGMLVTQLKCQDRDLLDSTRLGGHAQRFGASDVDAAPAALSRRVVDNRNKQTSMTGQNDLMLTTSPIRYWIKENGVNVLETSEFRLDPVSGQLVSRVELDREAREFYQLIVSCEDNGRPQSLESITPLFISILDQDDNKPEFVVPKQQQQQSSNGELEQRGGQQKRSMASINFMVEEHQSKGLQVGELRAIDRDLEARNPILYCLVNNSNSEFQLDQLTGVLYTNQSLDREKQAHYELLVKAINDGSTCEEQQRLHLENDATSSKSAGKQLVASDAVSYIKVHVEVQDINDNAPTFKRPTFRAGVHHRALMNTLVTQVAAQDPDFELNGALNYRISEILLYKTHPNHNNNQQQQQQQSTKQRASGGNSDELGKPIKLIQSPFKIDQAGNIYTQQLLTQYQLMSMFVLSIEASEQAEPRRVATTKLEIYVYETNSQLKIRINFHPRFVESYRHEIEQMLSNATHYKAVINRSRSYYGNAASGELPAASKNDYQRKKDGTGGLKVPTLDLAEMAPNSQDSISSEPNFSNILAIFIDNHRLANPHLVMEKLDLTSAQLFTPQALSQQFSASHQQQHDLLSRYNLGGNDGQATEVASLIDKIALASTHTTAEYQHSAGGHYSSSLMASIDWLEQPSMLYVALTSMLLLIGLLICTIGCCCTSRIKDHIIKVAMEKLVKQQTLQAKINERVLAATNQAYANSALQMATNGGGGGGSGAQNSDFILQQSGNGLMSSFDATKGCINNNYENMSILQRAMEAGEYIDPNYTTLNHHHHHLNLGAHYYDASELDQQQQQQLDDQQHFNNNLDHFDGQAVASSKQAGGSGSAISLSLGDEQDELVEDGGGLDLNMHDLKKSANGKLTHSNGVMGLVSSHHHSSSNNQQHISSRQRQQVPESHEHHHQLHL